MISKDDEKNLFEKRGLDMFSSIMTNELKNEIDQLLTEQQNFKLEILQLKKERNFLFTLLKKQDDKIKEKSKYCKFTLFHQEQVSLPPIEKDNKFDHLSDISNIDSASNILNDKKFYFTRSFFLNEIRKYYEIPLFERLLKILELSRNGDSMISYFVNTVGNAIINFDKKIQKLHGVINNLKKKKEEAAIDSIETINTSKKQDSNLFTELVNSYNFHSDNYNIDNDIFENSTHHLHLNNDLNDKIDNYDFDELNNSLYLNLNLVNIHDAFFCDQNTSDTDQFIDFNEYS